MAWVVSLLLPLLWVGEARSGGAIELDPFDRVALETAPGLGFTVIGGSLLEKQQKKTESRAQLQLAGTLRKAYLLWSGEVTGSIESAKTIRFVTPAGKAHSVQAQRMWRQPSAGTVYTALAEVTDRVKQSGRYGLQGLASDVVAPKGKDPYTVAGWALLALTENPAAQQNASVLFFAGLEILKPGEIYDLSLPLAGLPAGNWVLSKLGIVGGHGRAGNGSGNLLNGTAISGGDDWDGSAGKFWDIDLFAIEPPQPMRSGEPPTLTLDPLLQWLYPLALVLKLNDADSPK